MSPTVRIARVLAFAKLHHCSNEVAFVDGDAVQIPVDCRLADGRWFTEWNRVETIAEARAALGY
ncbi:MAG: hypothetical protein ACOY5R_06625 [Pseudomonadota bacterium]